MEKKQLASYILISLFLVHYSVSHSAYIFLNYYLNNFKLFEISLRKGEWYTSFIINNNNIIRMYLVTHCLTSYIFWWDRKVQFSNSINITFILCISQFLLLKTFFLFTSGFSMYQLSFSVFEPWTVESSMSPFILFWSFWYSYFCRCCACWLPYIKHTVLHGSHAL